jgi:hypothetical protein
MIKIHLEVLKKRVVADDKKTPGDEWIIIKKKMRFLCPV